ncbi:MAG: response regulator [Butyrivibrio sp.]|nr:response regulator [Muribaculum sp.]MCM1553490.1 response regulator [Butyrivibrio sp.]
MKKAEKKTTIRIFTTGILILAIIWVFGAYMRRNSERIAQQNASYIQSSTIETAGWIADILDNARSSINNMAGLYGQTLSSREVDSEDLKLMADRSLFDYVEFINADGMDINVQGIRTDVSDRNYFIKGMQGESGMDGTYVSRVTKEREVIFYAPVMYQDEIIGVLTGHYREERMREILDTELFGEQAPTLLCLADGTIVAEVGMDAQGDNVMDYLQDCVTPQEAEGIRSALSEERQFAFAYEGAEGSTLGYIASLPGNKWTIIQFFPIGALEQMQGRANEAGMILQVELIAFFVAYMVFLLVQEYRKRRKLSEGKREAENIVKGVNSLFAHFIIVNLEEDSYQYMGNRSPGLEGVAIEGAYTDFLEFWADKFVPEYDMVPMATVLSKEYIRENFPAAVPFERYEYQIVKGQEKLWESMALIILERREGQPTVVLLAIQEIMGMKQKELRTQMALREAYQAAEAANHAKSEFLSRMSHDIRTPMNAIMGMTAIAAMHMDDRARLEDCLSKISISSRHLLGLINEVLDMSKIESGKLELMAGEFDLSETVNELLGIFQPQIESKRQTLSVTLSGVMHEKLIGDAQRLSQVLVNIIGNAVKFTPEGGSISLHISELPSHIMGNGCFEFIVTDTGIGMDEEFAAKMFEPFARANDSRTGKIEGTGLGMSIAKSIVSMMNGDIQVKSRRGEGTQIATKVLLQLVEDSEEELSRLAGNRVMVVDDEQAACEDACNILNSIQMPAVWFTDGDSAIRELVRDYQEGGSYAAVILDWKMPKKDGVQVAREIRDRIGENIPIIILSAYDWSEIEQEALNSGVNEFIEKPLFKSRLIYVMKKVLLGQSDDKEEPDNILVQEQGFVDKRILLVEDNELNMEIAEEILVTAGFTVDKAVNGQEAVERLRESEPAAYQLVLMDIQMPVMNGYDAARSLRASEREDLRTIPIIAMTADAFSDDIQRAKDAGMNGHISKPIDIERLMETLKEWIR